MSSSKKIISLLLATRNFAFPLLFIATCAWGQTYTAVDLGQSISPFSVGSAGQAVGVIQNKDGYEQPLITVDGNVKALSALHNDDGARAVGVNPSGVVAGYSCLGAIPVCTAVTWTAGGAPKAFADRFYPAAINDTGEIVGSTFSEDNVLGLAVWQKGTLSPLPLFAQPQNGYVGGSVYAINNAGQVAGEIDLEDPTHPITGHAVVWNGSKIQDLGTNAGAKGINDHGQVVGFAGNDAALWTNGVLTDLGNLGGFSIAYGINNNGTIVGSADVPPYSSAAVVWINGVMYQLADIITPKLPVSVQLVSALAINDLGQIVAVGYDSVAQMSHTYILNPAGVVPRAAAPTFSVLPRTYASAQSVTIADVTPTTAIHYTLDGSTPSIQSAVYTGILSISRTTSLKAIAIAAGYVDSAVASADYTIVAPSVASTALNLSPVANVQAIGPLGVRAHVGLDGYRNVYASDLIGNSLYWSGVQFNFVSSPSENGAANLIIALPAGKYSAIKLLGTSTRGNRSGESFVITYADGSSSTVVQGMSDWATPQSYPGESTALTMDHRIEHSGTASEGPYHLYGYTLSLNPAKTVQSLTLPASGYVVVLAGALLSK